MALDYLSLRSSASATTSARVISCSTLTGSSLVGSSLGSFPTSLAVSTLTGSTLTAGSLGLSSLTGSTLTVGSLGLSSLTGSTLTAGSIGLSTITGSTMTLGSLGVSTLMGSTVTVNNVNTNTLGVSTLSVSTLLTSQGSGSVNTSTLMASTLTAVNINTSTLSVTSTMLSLGPNAQSTMTGASQGSYVAGSWQTAKSGLTNVRKLAMSGTGQYQLVVSVATSDLWLSSDSGVTWGSLGASQGLPALTGSAYWSAGAISATGQQITLAMYGGSLWFSSNYGQTFSVAAQQAPTIWAPLNGALTDLMGGAALTATGSPTYVTVAQPGFSQQAIYLANTASGTATQYLRGAWAGSSSFTISFWMNPQTVNGSAGQIIFSTYSNACTIYIDNTNKLNWYLPTGGGTNGTLMGTTPYTVTPNTWYYVCLIFQTNGLCSFYVNNTLISTLNNTQGVGTLTTTDISLGTYDVTTSSAFNGYIDDFRLTNTALSYVAVPHLAPVYWLSMEGSVADAGSYSIPNAGTPFVYLALEGAVTDSQGNSTVTATGSPVYVTTVRTGATGTQAIHLANTPGATATKYVRGTWTGSANSTISFWFNVQSLTGAYQSIFSSYSGSLAVAIDNSNRLYAVVPNGGGTSRTVIASSPALSTNQWYYVTVIFQTGGLCSFYLNNALIGTLTNSSGVGTLTTSVFELSGIDNDQTVAFNGYVDDVRIYNSAIPYLPVSVVNPVGTMAYVPGAVGSMALSLVNTAGGTVTNRIYGGFNTPTTYSGSGWFNLQSYSTSGNQFVFSTGGTGNGTVIVFIDTGSNHAIRLQIPNGIAITAIPAMLNTWYHYHFIIQPNPNLCYFYINGVQYTGTPNASANNSGIFTIGAFDPSTTNTYAFNGYVDDIRIYNGFVPYSSLFPLNHTHLVMSGNGVYQMSANSVGRLRLSSDSGTTWTIQSAATTPGTWSALSASYSGKYLTAQSQPVVQPNQSGLVAATWSQQGITYMATTSSFLSAGYEGYRAFDRNYSFRWVCSDNLYNGTTGAYTGSASTTIQGIGAVLGEWLQLQTSIPLVIQSYTFAAGFIASRLPKTYYIVGSNDGSTWSPVQYVNMTSSPFNTGTSIYKLCGNYLTVNYTGTQTLYGDFNVSGTTTSYSTSTTSYIYFRLITTTTYGGGEILLDIGEFVPNFVGGSITPNLTGLAAASWSTSGVSWTASASTTYSASTLAYGAFDVVSSIGTNNRWVSGTPGTYNSTTGAYVGSVTTAIQGVGSVLGEWLQLQASLPLVMHSYTYAPDDAQSRLPKIYYIVGSNDGSSWYPLQYISMTTNPCTASYTSCSTNLIMNYSGTQTIQGGQTGSGSTTAYASYVTQAWSYFRIVITNVYGGVDTLAAFGEFRPFFSAGQISSSNSGLTWTPTTQTGDAFNVTKNLTVTSTGTGFATLPAFRPVSTGLTFSIRFNIQSLPPDGAARLFEAALDTSLTQFIYITITSAGTFECVQTEGGALSLSTTWKYNTDYHLVWTIDGSGNWRGYLNGTQDASTTSNVIIIRTYPLFHIGKTANSAINRSPNMTVRDFRMFNRALNAAEVAQLYSNVNYGQPAVGPLTLSESGEYALAAHQSTVAVGSGYLAGHQVSSYSNPLLSGINAPVVDTAVSQTGQFMVLVTSGATNNVYYSRDYGATFTGLTLGSTPMVSCAISNDGSYLTVSNGTTTYRLNSNSTGYSVAVGSQAGQLNQAANAIAIGNLAGQVNQTANSIVLNATGSAVNTGSSGFYVAPISGPSGLGMNLLGYGSDSQVTTTGITVAPGGTTASVGIGGSVGIGITNPNARLQVYGVPSSNGVLVVNSQSSLSTGQGAFDILHRLNEQVVGNDCFLDHMWLRTSVGSDWTTVGLRIQAKTDATWQGYIQFNGTGNTYGLSFGYGSSNSSPLGVLEGMRLTNTGSVGIGLTNPSQRLDVNGSINCTGLLVNGTAVATGTGSVWGVSGSNISYTSGQVSIGTAAMPASNSAGTTNLINYGNICVYRNRVIFSNALTDWNHSIYNNGQNIDGEGAWDGFKMNVYAGLSVRLGNSNGVTPTTAFYINNSGQVGIGTTNPGYPFHVHGTAEQVAYFRNSSTYARIMLDGSAGTGGDIIFRDGGTSRYGIACIASKLQFLLNDSVSTIPLTMDTSGRIGIGIASPLGKLHIVTADPGSTTGAISFQNANGFGIYANSSAIGSRGNTLDFYSSDYNNNAATTRHILTMRPEGYVGIGTANPSVNNKLHIHGATASGGLLISNTTNVNAQAIFGVDGSGNCLVTPILQGSFFSGFLPGGDNQNNLGALAYRWTAVYAANGTIQTSDSSVKDSVPLPYGIQEILQMRTIKYKWKSQADLPDDDPKKNFEYYGFCADELGSLFPELVYDEDKNAPVQMNYTELLPVVVNALKQEHAERVALQTQLNEKSAEIATLQRNQDALLAWARGQGFAG